MPDASTVMGDSSADSPGLRANRRSRPTSSSRLFGIKDGHSNRKSLYWSDGADDLRTVVELAIGLKPRTILDWFHISMRLRCIDQIAIALLSRFPAGDFKEKLGLLTRVRWSMWNGQWVRAIERLRDAFRAGRASIEATSAADRQRIVRLNNRLL